MKSEQIRSDWILPDCEKTKKKKKNGNQESGQVHFEYWISLTELYHVKYTLYNLHCTPVGQYTYFTGFFYPGENLKMENGKDFFFEYKYKIQKENPNHKNRIWHETRIEWMRMNEFQNLESRFLKWHGTFIISFFSFFLLYVYVICNLFSGMRQPNSSYFLFFSSSPFQKYR